jgi:hypothetical protein
MLIKNIYLIIAKIPTIISYAILNKGIFFANPNNDPGYPFPSHLEKTLYIIREFFNRLLKAWPKYNAMQILCQ